MKSPRAFVVPLGIVKMPPRDNEDKLHLTGTGFGLVGTHVFCNGPVIVQETASCNMLKCSACNIILATFPQEIQTYAQLRKYFGQVAEKFM